MEKQIVLTDTYMTSSAKLTSHERKAALTTIKQMKEDLSTPSLNVHDLSASKCDPRFRSARVNKDLRIIFMHSGDYCTLLYIDHHDDAYDWAVGKFFKKTDFGATYIFDTVKEEKQIEEFSADYYIDEKGVLELNGISQKELVKLGLPSIHAENLIRIVDQEDFVDYVVIFPEEIQEALYDLFDGTRSFEEVYNDLQDMGIEENEACVDDELNLWQKDSKRRFYVTQSMEELEHLIENEKFEKWTIFLHPSQERLVRINANGPMLVEGGPGTGKTVLGMHRAAYLSEKIYRKEDGCKILFCTYSRKLARYISNNIRKLYEQKGIPFNVDVIGVDAFFRQSLGSEDLHVDQTKFNDMMRSLYNRGGWDYSFSFYEYEYYQVIEHFGILKKSDYLNADRKGMGTPLTQSQREIVWEFFQELFKFQKEKQIHTFVNRAEKLGMLLDSKEITIEYDAVIIDEAQDLEPAKLKTLSKCLKNRQNGMMILSDNNQRIYNLNSWKGDIDIDIVGRTYYLYLNYRTTKEICDYAGTLFFKNSKKTDYMQLYKSIVKGNEPIVQGYKNEEKQYEAIAATVTTMNRNGLALNEICVVLPTDDEIEKMTKILEKYSINHLVLRNDKIPSDTSGVCICTTKGVKGLEFGVVIITSSEKIGRTSQIRKLPDSLAKDKVKKQIECERYVAATRARDTLIVTYVEE